MKKKIAVILCLVLCSMSLFGCSNAEVAALKMAQEMIKITEYELSGNVEVFYDATKLKAFIADSIDSTEYTKEEIAAQLSVLSGDKKINLKYDGSVKMNNEDMALYVNLSSTIDGKAAPLGKLYASVTEGVYVEKAFLLNLYKASALVLTGSKDSYIYSDQYAKDFEAALGTAEYIEIVSADAMEEMFTAGGMVDMLSNASERNTKIYDAAIKFLTDAFSGYSTGVLKQTATGYEISANGEDIVKIVSDVLDYCSKNINTVADSLEIYMNAVMESMMDSYPPEIQKELQGSEEYFKWGKEERSEMAKAIASIKAGFDYWIAGADLDLKALNYEESVRKEGNSYIGTSQLQLSQGGSSIAYIKSESIVSDKKVTIAVPKAGTPIGSVMDNLTAVENKYNPVTGLKITWQKYSGKVYDDGDYCDITYTNKYASPISPKDQYTWAEYYNINKEMYIPLRDISDLLGENLQWDNKAKTAYVMKDGKKIVMNSVLRDGKSYAKIKDFEKLGYTVVYDGSVAGLHTVTVSVK